MAPLRSTESIVKGVDPELVRGLGESLGIDDPVIIGQMVSDFASELEQAGYQSSKENVDEILAIASLIAPTVVSTKEKAAINKGYVGTPLPADLSMLEVLIWTLVIGALKEIGKTVVEKGLPAAKRRLAGLLKKKGYKKSDEVDQVWKLVLEISGNKRLKGSIELRLSRLRRNDP